MGEQPNHPMLRGQPVQRDPISGPYKLEDILRAEQTTAEREGSESAPAPAPTPTDTAIGRAAALHGTELLRLQFTVDQVVHGYGDVCQAVTGLAVEKHVIITSGEFRTLNRCLDNAIADAVTAYARTSEHADASRQGSMDDFADEHRRLVDIVANAFSAIKTGNVGLTGATGALLVHALEELRLLPGRMMPKFSAASTANQDKTGELASG